MIDFKVSFTNLKNLELTMSAKKSANSRNAAKRAGKSVKKSASKSDSIKNNKADTLRVKRQVLKEISDIKNRLRQRRIHGNEDKKRIAIDMLERYTGHSIEQFQKQIILTNFHYYMERFNALLPDAEYTQGSAFKASSSKKQKLQLLNLV